MNTPRGVYKISIEEWRELMKLPEVRKHWKLTETDTPEHFSKMVDGTKILLYSTDSHPDYLFILDKGGAYQQDLMVLRL